MPDLRLVLKKAYMFHTYSRHFCHRWENDRLGITCWSWEEDDKHVKNCPRKVPIKLQMHE